MLYVGIDLGGTGIKAGLVNEEGTIVARAECPTGVERGHEAVIADMAKLALDVIAKGGAYTAEPIAASTMPPAVTETTLTAVVDGQTVEVPAAVMTPGNYCVTAEGLASLLGVSVALTDGVLTITTAA